MKWFDCKKYKIFYDDFSGKKLILPNGVMLSEVDLRTTKTTLEDLKRKGISE